ncbi:MAG TPA: hypothetical protein VIW72_01140 [Burkholderiales bacterium]
MTLHFRIHSFQRIFESSRFGALYLAAAIYVAISATTGLILSVLAIRQGQIEASALLAVIPIGTLYDLVTCLYLFAPFALYLFLIPQKLFNSKAQRLFMTVVFSATVFGLMYLGAVEYYFFDEFNSRFNFVAVEYLIYPHEVFVNIWESYPVARALLAITLITAVLMWRLYPRLRARHAGRAFSIAPTVDGADLLAGDAGPV